MCAGPLRPPILKAFDEKDMLVATVFDKECRADTMKAHNTLIYIYIYDG